jgi:hypothetical protein
MALPDSTRGKKRWRLLLLGLCLTLLVGGLWYWNNDRAASRFYGRWRLVDPLHIARCEATFEPDGHADLPWVSSEGGSITLNQNLQWRVRSDELIVEPFGRPHPKMGWRDRFRYWVYRLTSDDTCEQRLEIIEISDQKLRLRWKSEGAPESVYVRIDTP